MKTIIENTKNLIASIPELKYVDENWGQLDHYSPNFPVKWPCVLIDIANIRFSDIGMDKTATPKNRQQGDFQLEIRVANMKLSNSSTRAPQSQKDAVNSIWNIIEEIHNKVQGFEATALCGKMIRVGQERVVREDGIQEYAIIYSGSMSNV